MSFSFGDEDHSLPLNDDSVLPTVKGTMSERSILLNVSTESQRNAHSQSVFGPSAATIAASNHSAISSTAGCTMKEYEEQLTSLRKENLNLKLRIYMMEKSFGNRVGNMEDKENVYKINVDLRIESEELKKELSEKTDLLGQAYSALSNLEEVYKDAERETEELRNQINKLKQTSRTMNESEDIKILHDAFGTLNEGKDESLKDQVEYYEEFLRNLYDFLNDNDDDEGDVFKPEQLEKLIRELKDRSLLADTFKSEIEKLTSELEDRNRQVSEFVSTMSSMKKELLMLSTEKQANDNFDVVEIIQTAQKQIVDLKKALDNKDSFLRQTQDELDQERRTNDRIEKDLTVEKEANRDLEKEIQIKTQEISKLKKDDERSEKLTKSYEFCQGLIKALAEQKEASFKVKKESKAKDLVIKRITDEYNDLKAKVRTMKSNGTLISELDDVKSREALLSAEAEDLKDRLKDLEYDGNDGILDLIKEMKLRYLRRGCMKTLEACQSSCESRLRNVKSNVHAAVKIMRTRLEELADFLQSLLDDGEIGRRMSVEFRDSLHKSLNESRRLSTSVLHDDLSVSSSSYLNESNIVVDEIEAAFDGLAAELVSEIRFENVIKDDKDEFFKEDMKLVQSFKKFQELESELKERKNEITELNSIKTELKTEIDHYRHSAEMATSEFQKLSSELAEKSTKLRDEERRVESLSGKLKELMEKERKTNLCFETEIQNMKNELESSAIRRKEAEVELASLRSEQQRMLECCDDNERLKNELEKTKSMFNSLKDALNKEKIRRREEEKQMSSQLLKTKQVLKQTKRFAAENKEN